MKRKTTKTTKRKTTKTTKRATTVPICPECKRVFNSTEHARQQIDKAIKLLKSCYSDLDRFYFGGPRYAVHSAMAELSLAETALAQLVQEEEDARHRASMPK